MSSKLDKYLVLKKKVDEAQQKADRAEGGLREVMATIKQEFHCDNLGEAKAKLKRLKKEEQSSKEAFDKALDFFEEEWEKQDD